MVSQDIGTDLFIDGHYYTVDESFTSGLLNIYLELDAEETGIN